MLQIPKTYKVLTAISVGYPDEDPKPRPRLPLDELIFYGVFGRKETYEEQDQEKKV